MARLIRWLKRFLIRRFSIEIIRNATNMEGVPSQIRMPSPLKGQHSKEVLLEFGFTEEEIEELSLGGVVEGNPG